MKSYNPSFFRSPWSAWGLLSALFSALFCLSASAQVSEPEQNPAFNDNVEIVLSPQIKTPGIVEDGSELHPFCVGGPHNFDQFMRKFQGIPNLTFRLLEGTFETGGNYEIPPQGVPSPDLWQPDNGWRIVGAGMGKTILRLTDPFETNPAKYQVIANFTPRKFIENLEIAHMTLDADGGRHSQRLNSSFGCVAITGSFIHLHHLECLNGFNALSPNAGSAAVHRELFILGIGGEDGRQVTNNWIRKCVVRLHPDSPKQFPNAIEALTSLVVNAANLHGSDDIPDYTWRPLIQDCVMDGVSANRRVNGFGMFGCVDGVCRGNRAVNTRFGFYTDSGDWSPSLYIQNNVISNSLLGIYFNYQIPSLRWGNAVIQSNVVYTCEDCAASSSSYTIGICLLGMVNAKTSSFDNIVISSNQVVAIPRLPPGTIPDSLWLDYGIQVINAKAALIDNNVVTLTRGYRSIRTWPMPGLQQYVRIGKNYNRRGEELSCIDMSVAGCRDTYLSSVPPCVIAADDPSSPLLRPPFEFAAQVPAPYDYLPPPSRPLTKHLVMLAKDGELTSPAFTNATPESWSGVSVVSTNLDRGSVQLRFYVADPLTYQVWAKIKAPSVRTTGFFDVELDGERRLFGALNITEGTNWTWRPVTERLPGAPANLIRKVHLNTGWHSLTFWMRNPGVQLDMICVTSSSELIFIPNDSLLQNLLATRPGNMTRATLAHECPWTSTVQAESGDLTAPMEIVSDRGAYGLSAVASAVPHRGEITKRFAVPDTQLYEIAVRLKPNEDSPRDASIVMILDGEEWVMIANAEPRWQWVNRAGATQSEAQSADKATTGFRLTSGQHRLTLRARDPGVSIDAIRITSIPKKS